MLGWIFTQSYVFCLARKLQYNIVDGVSCRVDARRCKECRGVTGSYKMKRFHKVDNKKYETKSIILHFDLESLSDSIIGSHAIPTKAVCSQTFALQELL